MLVAFAKLETEHESAGAALARFKELTDSYTPPDWACNTFRALYDGLADPGFPGPPTPAEDQHSANAVAAISPTSDHAASTPPADSTSEAEDEPHEHASSPCYLSEFTD